MTAPSSVGGPERHAHATVVERIEQVARLPAGQVDEIRLADRRDGGRVVRVLRTANEDGLHFRAEPREVRLSLRDPAAEDRLAVRP